MTQALTISEQADWHAAKKKLKELHSGAVKGAECLIEMGRIMDDVVTRRLYRTEGATLEEACEKVFGWSASYCRNIRRAGRFAEAQKLLSEMGTPNIKVPQTTEAAVKQIAAGISQAKALETERNLSTFQPQNKNNSSPAPAAEPSKPTPSMGNVPVKPAAVLDETGCQIPSEIVPLWNRRGEMTHLMTEVSRIKCAIEKALNDEDPLFYRVSNIILADLGTVRVRLSESMFYTVCMDCQGHPKTKQGGCALCASTGLITKKQYTEAVNPELRAVRERSIKLKQSHGHVARLSA